MAHRKRSHTSFENVENNIVQKWINGLLYGAKMRAALWEFAGRKKAAPPTREKSH
jgi:hypothetical protein